ncbi:MAG TPA: glycosyltransferase family 4 protein [Elusimicrobiota bacterium]|nr:glycosyltransferase family 4 protein [Elusimicrobiota bacterium]
MISVAFPVRNFSLTSGVSRCVVETVRRLPGSGFTPVVYAHRLPPALPSDVCVKTVPMVPLSSWGRAASFDAFFRWRARRDGIGLVHGQGDVTRQDVVTVNNCDAAAAHYVPDGRRPSSGVRYVRERQFSGSGSRTVIAISRRVREDVIRFYGVPEEKVRIVTYGVDSERYTPARRTELRGRWLGEWGWPSSAFVVLSVVSGDVSKRNVSLLIRAASSLARSTPLHLCLVGGFSEKDDHFRTCSAEIRSLMDMNRIRMCPHARNVEEYYPAADVFVLAAHYEEWGLTTMEAMSSGCPAIVSRMAGSSELLTDGKDGYVLADLADPAELMEKLTTLASPERAREMGRCARAAMERYTWPLYVQSLAGIYRELI